MNTHHTHHYPSTGHTNAPTMSRASSASRYSNDAMTYDSGKNTPLDPPSPLPSSTSLPSAGTSLGCVPIPPRRESLRKQESDSSLATTLSVDTQRATAGPQRALRSQVSMEVLPSPMDGMPYDRSLRSYRSASSLGSTAQSTRGEVRFSDSSTLRSHFMDDLVAAGPSRPPRSARRIVANHALSDDEDDDDDDDDDGVLSDNETTPRQTANATLRSTPGVVGIGEGWGSRPPSTPKRKWWKKRQDTSVDTADPLNLWSTDTSTGRREQGEKSPRKSLWNRSMQRFGGSMPHLPSALGERNKERKKHNDESVQRSRSDLSPIRGKNLGAGRSLVDLLHRPLKALHKQPGSRSVPALLSTLRPDNGEASPLRRTPSQIRRARSRGSAAMSDMSVSAPPPMTREQRRTSGPRPPWRPASYFAPTSTSASGEACPDVIEEPYEDTMDSRPFTPEPPTLLPNDDRELTRTDTFGPAPVPASPERSPNRPAVSKGPATYSNPAAQQSAVGFDTLDEWALEPKERMILPSPNKPSFFRRITNALRRSSTRSVGNSRPQTPSSLRLSPLPKYRSGTPRSETSTPVQMGSARPSAIHRSGSDVDHVLQPVRDSLPERSKTISETTRHRRRKSWMSGGEGWVKRLSRLPEQDEDQIVESSDSLVPDAAPGSDKRQSFLDLVKLGRTHGATSPLSFNNASRRSSRMYDSGPVVSPGGLYSLRRLATTDLDLTLTLPEERGFDLDDILIDSRRKSIIASLDLTSGFAFPTPPARDTSTFDLARKESSRSYHSRGISEPPRLMVNTERDEVNHKRNRSEPVDGVPLLSESITTSEGDSSSFPETPRLENNTITKNTTYSRRVSKTEGEDARWSLASDSTERERWSFHSAVEVLEDEKEGLAASDAGSRCSIVSEAGELTQAHPTWKVR